MGDGDPSIRLHYVQSCCGLRARALLDLAALSLPPLPDAVAGNTLGYFSSCSQMETHAYRHPPVDRQYSVDCIVHSHKGVVMDEVKWELLTEVQGRLEAVLLKTYFEAYGK